MFKKTKVFCSFFSLIYWQQGQRTSILLIAFSFIYFAMSDNAYAKGSLVYGNWDCQTNWETENFTGFEEVKIMISENSRIYHQIGEIVVKPKQDTLELKSVLSYRAALTYEYNEPNMVSTSENFEIITLVNRGQFFDRVTLESLNLKGRKLVSTLKFIDKNTLISESESGTIYTCSREIE